MSISLLLGMAQGSALAIRGDAAVVSGELRWSVEDLSALADGGSGVIAASGASHVAYVGAGGSMLPLLLFASARAAVPVTPLNYRLSGDGLRTLIRRLPNPLVIADYEYLDAVGDIGKQIMSAADFLAAARTAEPAGEFSDPDAVAVVLFTSGITSAPKAVELTHNNVTSYIMGTVEFDSAQPGEAALICVPPYHIAGVSAALSNLYAGRKMVTLTHLAIRLPSSLAMDPRWSRWQGRSSPNHTPHVRSSRKQAAPSATRRRGSPTAFARWSRGYVASDGSAEFAWTGAKNT